MGAVRPSHIDLVDHLRCPQTKVCARIVRAEERIASSHVPELRAARCLDHDLRSKGTRSAPAILGRDDQPGAGRASVVQKAGRSVEMSDEQIEPAVVVEITDRQPAAGPPLLESWTGIGRCVAEHRRRTWPPILGEQISLRVCLAMFPHTTHIETVVALTRS